MKILSFIICLLTSVISIAQIDSVCFVNLMLVDSRSGEEMGRELINTYHSNESEIRAKQFISDNDGIIQIGLPSDAKYIILIGLVNDTINLQSDFCNKTIVHGVSKSQNLNEVSVTGFLNDSKRNTIPASIGYIDQKILSSTDRTSLQNSFNTIPGVIMESRGYGGSQRINIRGSALRSPFAIRNIKMYVDGIPLTTPDGQSPLELIDAADIRSVEVIKGPAGSVWGSGNGGVVLFKSNLAAPGTTTVSHSAQVGSYNLFRNATSIQLGFKKSGIRISHIYQDNKGYRTQEFSHKNQLSISGRHYINAKHMLSHYHNYYNGNWGLPGALNQSEAEKNPRQANAFSHLINAHVRRERIMSGAAHQWNINKNFQSNTSDYFYHTDKINPFGIRAASSGYKIEKANGTGGRADLKYDKKINRNIDLTAHAGIEMQYEKYSILEKEIVEAQPADFRYKYDINYLSELYYLTTDIKIKNKVTLNAGVSINKVQQKIKGNTATNFVYDTTATWGYQTLPRFAIHYAFHVDHHIYVSRSNGNSNPTAFEMVDYENNTFNLNLNPESGINYEAGLKGNLKKIEIQYEFSVYRFKLTNAILAYNSTFQVNDTTTAELTLYNNLGSTIQDGIEWNLSKKFAVGSSRHLLNVFSNGSAFFYRFRNYPIEEENPKGKNLPGTPLANLTSGIQYSWLNKFDISVLHYYTDRTPLNNNNSVWSKPLHLMNIRSSYTFTLKKLETTIYAGINNALNTDYTSFHNLNGFNNRFYNPAPRMNFFGGIEFKILVK